MLSNILVVIICHYVTGAKFKEEVLTHIKHHTACFIRGYVPQYLFRQNTNFFQLEHIFFLNGLGIGWG